MHARSEATLLGTEQAAGQPGSQLFVFGLQVPPAHCESLVQRTHFAFADVCPRQ